MNTLLPQTSLHRVFQGKYKIALTQLWITNRLTTASRLKHGNEDFDRLLRLLVKTLKHGEKNKNALS